MDLRGAEVGGYGQDFVGVGGIHLPGLNGFFAVEGGRHGLDAAAAVDVGFELKGLHGAEKWGGAEHVGRSNSTDKFTASSVCQEYSIISATGRIWHYPPRVSHAKGLLQNTGQPFC